MMHENGRQRRWKGFTEEIEVAGGQLVDRVTELLKEGNVRSLRVKTADGRVFLELPLTIGAGIGGVVVLAAPWLALLTGLAGVFARVRLEVVRNRPEGGASEDAKRDETPRRGPEDIDL